MTANVAMIMPANDATHPAKYVAPFTAPRRELRIRMKPTKGTGSSVMITPSESRSHIICLATCERRGPDLRPSQQRSTHFSSHHRRTSCSCLSCDQVGDAAHLAVAAAANSARVPGVRRCREADALGSQSCSLMDPVLGLESKPTQGAIMTVGLIAPRSA